MAAKRARRTMAEVADVLDGRRGKLVRIAQHLGHAQLHRLLVDVRG
jgi:hypothetical protein